MKIDDNHVVSIEYEVKEPGSEEVIDTNKGKDPLEFIMGQGQIIPGLESSLKGMSMGESANISIQPKDAYGEYNAEALQKFPKDQFGDIDLEQGMVLYGQTEDNKTVQVTVKDFEGEDVIIDYNHPLAGKDLSFDVSILSVRAATDQELQTGVLGGSECCGNGCGGH